MANPIEVAAAAVVVLLVVLVSGSDASAVFVFGGDGLVCGLAHLKHTHIMMQWRPWWYGMVQGG
jgi:hypothetical protein